MIDETLHVVWREEWWVGVVTDLPYLGIHGSALDEHIR